MRLELVQFENTNHILLPGLLYEPNEKTDRILIKLHGNGSAGGLYGVDNNNILGKSLSDKGIAYLPFTNTGGHIVQRFTKLNNGRIERVMFGSGLEIIKDCIYDIDGAINFSRSRGYKHIYLIGSSTGANKIAVYNRDKVNNEIEKYILVSGGDDAGMFYSIAGGSKFKGMLNKCRQMIRQGKGLEFAPIKVTETPLSYQSLYDQINPEGDYNIFPFYWQLNKIEIMDKKAFGEFAAINKPTLVIYGSEDEFCYGRMADCVKLLKNATANKNNFKFEIIAGADHGISDHAQHLVSKVLEFLGN